MTGSLAKARDYADTPAEWTLDQVQGSGLGTVIYNDDTTVFAAVMVSSIPPASTSR